LHFPSQIISEFNTEKIMKIDRPLSKL